MASKWSLLETKLTFLFENEVLKMPEILEQFYDQLYVKRKWQ